MKNTLETRLGIFFALTLVTAFLIIEMLGGSDFFKSGYHVKARFNNIQELKVGDPVKVSGYKVGRVDKIDLAGDKVEVLMRLNSEAELHTDSKAVIKFAGLLGQNFVAVSFGTRTAPKAIEGALLESGEQPDLSSVMAKLEGVATGIENVTKTFSGQNFGDLFGPVTDFLKENNPKMSAILGNLQNMTTQMADGKGTVGKLITDDQLYSMAVDSVKNLNETAADVRGVINKANAIVDQINKGEGTLGKLTKDEKLYSETTTAMTSLKEILQKINKGEGSVGKLVNDESLFKNAKMTLQKLDKATEGLEDQGPLSVLGIMINNLF